MGQNGRIISGTISDSSGHVIQGVSITIKGSKKGTVSDAKGNFTISLAPSNKTLVFSLVGYTTKELNVADQSNVSIVLNQVATALEQVVVVAYGAQKKVNLTGAVANVTAAQLENRPVTGVVNALQGTVPGLTIVSNNGQPGADQGKINIRGIGTLNNTDPMIVIDGVIGTPTDMNAINADDIDNISVLKDAASASIYGSRAANGVILLTTKKGKKGSSQITYSTYIGKQSIIELPDYLPSWQAATLYNQARINEGGVATYTQAQIDTFKNGLNRVAYPNTDWLGLFWSGNGFQQNHYLGVSGGSDKVQYLFSLGYLDQQGISKNTKGQRYTARLNLTAKVKDNLTVNADISYTYAPYTEPQSSLTADQSFGQVIRQVNRISNIIPYKYPNGDYGHISDGNPMAWVNSPSFHTYSPNTLIATANADWELIKGLHFRPSLNYKLLQAKNIAFVSSIQYYNADGTTSGQANVANATNTYTNTTVITPQALFDYGIKFGDHNFKALAGYSEEYTNYYMLQGYRQGFLNNSLSSLNVASTAGQTTTSDSYEVGLESYFGRINYDYKGRYLLEGNLRYDGSSRFAPSQRWGTFPSASAGWRISQENFFDQYKSTVSNLKLRASWGKLGNQNIAGIYPYIPTISTGQNYNFGGSIAAGIAPVNGTNAVITWETTTETDFGFDMDILKNFNFTADYFIKNTDGILYQLPIAATYGLTAPFQNTASVQNNGWEFILGYHDRKGGFTYSATGNLSFVSNKVTDLGPSSSPVISGATITKVGLPINGFWGYQSEGIFQNQSQITSHATQNFGHPSAPGDLIYKDISGPNGKPDGVIDGNDKTYLGTNFPKVSFGLNLNVGWNGFDFTAFFQGTAGVKNIISGPILGQNGNAVGKPTSALLDSWSSTNTSAALPRLWINYQQNDPSQVPSSFWIRNASYVRLKNLQLGYTFPDRWIKPAHIQKLRIYYSGQNIFTWSKFYSWVDPEAPSQTIGASYPQVKTHTIGLNLTF